MNQKNQQKKPCSQTYLNKMKTEIKPLKQTTEFGCLATCYTMIKNHFDKEDNFSQEIESNLTKEAFRSETGFNEHYYLKELYKKGYEIKIFVETPYMLDGYNQLNTKLKCNIPIEHSLTGVEDYIDLMKQGYIIITLIDLWYLDMIIHFPHYVIVNGFNENSIYIVDPKYCREIKISKEKFNKILHSIQNRLNYSQVIFAIKKSNTTHQQTGQYNK